MGISETLAGLKLGRHKPDPHKPPFEHIPGYLWQYSHEKDKGWHLIPDTTKYSGKIATHMGIKDASMIPVGWMPSDGLIPGWKLPRGISKYFPGGILPGQKKPKRFRKVQDGDADWQPLLHRD